MPICTKCIHPTLCLTVDRTRTVTHRDHTMATRDTAAMGTAQDTDREAEAIQVGGVITAVIEEECLTDSEVEAGAVTEETEGDIRAATDVITAGETTAVPTAMATRNEGVEASPEEAQGEQDVAVQKEEGSTTRVEVLVVHVGEILEDSENPNLTSRQHKDNRRKEVLEHLSELLKSFMICG
ncbi:uncharacterized protein LOC128162393 [Crassostrea angulata]|uniref:uncharacterized protein LOC128162393 n=1 Tax=Magallana angulata TaxID=2784310 RepID=UPI0022B1290B|nr:uncharacterized protein LOC128162393 [Crassostrea angulata]